MRRMRLAPKGRLSGQLVVCGLAVLAIALFCSMLVAVHQEDRLVFRLVQQRASLLEELADAQLDAGAGWGYIARRASDLDALPAHLQALQPGYHLVARDAEIEHVLVRDRSSARIFAVYGDAPHRQRIQAHLRIVIGLFLVLGASLVVIAKWWASTLVHLRPAAHRRIERQRDGASPEAGPDERASLALPYGQYQEATLASQQREREFIANVGHELRTPITLVMTGCELLADNASLDATARRQLDRIATAAEHMNETVRSFLILARDGSFGRSEPVELRACVLEALEPHAQDIQARQLSVQVNVGADAIIEANREALFVVVGNLVKNAVAYTERGGISIHHLGQTLYVADTGCGIGDGDLPLLFQPFFRARSVAEAGLPGLGLGLAIVKRICDFYGWSITARSTPGRGTTMSVEFSRSNPNLF